jgi:hypothetical protein
MNSAPYALPLIVLLALSGLANAQPRDPVKEPPRAEKLDIQLRYRIRAERDERVRQYRSLMKYLESLGFQDARADDPNRDLDILDPNAERFVGTISSAKVLDTLNDSRIQNILFAPSGYMYPDSGDKPVPIRIMLRAGLIPSAQQALYLQALAQLELLGYKDFLGYDTRGYTQLKGTIPYKYLDRLVKDLRTEPAGWFLPNTPVDQLPRPLADRNPIRWVEVMTAADIPPPFAPEAVLPARARLSPDLRALLNDPGAKETPLRVEALFATPMEERLETIRPRLINDYGPSPKPGAGGAPAKGLQSLAARTEGASIEGVIGNVVTLRFDRPADAERFAFEPDVLSVRLPRRGLDTVLPPVADQTPTSIPDLLKTSGVSTLQRLGYTGTGVKVIVLGTDFTGADRLIGAGLPKNTRILDLTTELSFDLRPLPVEEGRAAANIGVARAVALAAPDAELVLVRIDPGSFFQLQEVMRFARAEAGYSEAMRTRLIELSRHSTDVTNRKDAALIEYRQAFEDLADDEPTRERRARAKATLDAILQEQHRLSERFERYSVLQRQIPLLLGGARVIVNPLVWESGYPLDALSDMSRTLERIAAPTPPTTIRPATGRLATPKPHLVWVQASSPFAASVWGGPFRDVNRNGTMEFAPPTQPLPEGSWSPELNFLGLRSSGGETAADLPAGAKLRVVMQWREPLDPNVPGLNLPAYPVVLRVFRQMDPSGEKRPSDEMVEEARSVGGPFAISRTSTYVVYEQILDFTAPSPGRYALVATTGYQPDPRLPALRRDVEISPRIFVETLSSKPGEGQVVFRSYRNPKAGVGIPSDSPGVVTVGVPVAGSLAGGGTGVTLLVKPDILGPDVLDLGNGAALRGPGVATGYVAGIATALVQANVSGANVFRTVGVSPGKLPVLPEAWLRYLRPQTSTAIR